MGEVTVSICVLLSFQVIYPYKQLRTTESCSLWQKYQLPISSFFLNIHS